MSGTRSSEVAINRTLQDPGTAALEREYCQGMVRPISLALLSLASMASFAQVERGEPLPRKIALGAQIKDSETAGVKSVEIVAVIPGLTAEAMKFQAGDHVVEFAGQKVTDRGGLIGLLKTVPGGSVVKSKVVRGGKETELTGQAVERPRQKADGFQVHYDQVKSGKNRIRVIATHPEGKGPFPTIFMIGGIGAYSMDGDYETTPYGTILGPAAKSGYAVVRIDKPGQGDSEGPAYTDLLFDDELAAYVDALRLTKTLPFVDKDRIAIFGHSMGGAFGPLVGAVEPVKGICVSGTMSKTWVEYWLENVRRQSMLAGADPADLDQEMRQLAGVCHYVYQEDMSVDEVAAKHAELAAAAREMAPDGKTVSGVGIPFFQQLEKKNLMKAWSQCKSKIMIAYCENDFLSGEWDHRFIVDSVNRWRPGTAEFHLIKESDHGFNKTSSQKDSMEKWGRPGATFNPAFKDAFLDWLKATLG